MQRYQNCPILCFYKFKLLPYLKCYTPGNTRIVKNSLPHIILFFPTNILYDFNNNDL